MSGCKPRRRWKAWRWRRSACRRCRAAPTRPSSRGRRARLADTDRALKIEPALTEALLDDVEAGGGKDALPLLAFTLERLYLEYGGGGA